MSTSEFTPTEDDLRDYYTVFRQTGESTFAYDDKADALEFDRAIAKIKAEAKVEALQEAMNTLAGEDTVEWARKATHSTMTYAYIMEVMDDLIEQETAA